MHKMVRDGGALGDGGGFPSYKEATRLLKEVWHESFVLTSSTFRF